MARVNLEENFFGERRLYRFQEIMGWSRPKAIGTLTLLWHDSQELLRIEGSTEEISEWCWATTHEEGLKIVSALTACGFISMLANGNFLIHGNEKQIEARVQKVDASKKGGAATQKKWAKNKKRGDNKPSKSKKKSDEGREASLTEAARPSSGLGDEGRHQAQCKAMQDNAAQLNSVQGNAVSFPGESDDSPQTALVPVKKSKPAKTPKAEPPTRAAWEAYSAAYQAEYGHLPVRTATTNGQMAQLVGRLGSEAPDVLRFFLTHKNAWYVRQVHAIGCALKDAEPLRTQWAANHRVTATAAQDIDKRSEQAQIFERVAAKFRAQEAGNGDQ
jgi:hypothetical protein